MAANGEQESDDLGEAERWALVAGGSGGIGRAICGALAEDGWSVAVAYNQNEEGARRTLARVTAVGGQGRTLQIDLRDGAACESIVAELAAAVPLAGIVYAAGPRIPLDYLAKVEPDQFGGVVDVDVKGCFNVLRAGLRHLRDRGGSIVALSTQAAARYAKRDSLSSVPKSAVEAIVKAIAVEEGRYGVTANTIGVGMLEGEGMWESMHSSGEYTKTMLDAALAATPMRRFGSPHDIACLARFLMSAQAGWITGQTINVDGGYSV